MKYFKIIIFIFLAVTVGTFLSMRVSDKTPDEREMILTVNGKGFTLDEINAYFSGRLSTDEDGHHGDLTTQLQAFAGERALILEAEEQKIDQDQDFRTKIQRYYEHSLISALRNRQEKKFRQEVADETARFLEQDIDRFIGLYGCQVTYRLSTDTSDTTVLFDMIPNMYKPVIAAMEPGQTEDVLVTGNAPHQVKLIQIGPKGEELHPLKDRLKIKQMILDYRIEAKLRNWEQDIIDNAAIIYHTEK